MDCRSQRCRPAFKRCAFTLVELLVVIGIIAVLISVLLPVLGSARRSAYKTKCLAALHQMGDAYKMYANENRGAWPICAHFYNGAAPYPDRDKRWHDFIARYIMPPQQAVDKASGKVYKEKDMNFNGTCSNTTLNTGGTTYANHGDFGTDMDPIWIGTLRDRNSVLWGCPSWNRIGTGGTQFEVGANNGYVMNIFPKAPLDISAGFGSLYNLDPNKVAWIVNSASGGSTFNGKYFKMTAWTRSADRALLYEGVHNGGYWIDPNLNIGWPYFPDTTTPLPMFPVYQMPIDWNRHSSKRPGVTTSTDPALNMLFCDGHAATVSARQAYKAIRFK